MEAIIGRSAAPAERIFPLPTPDLYQQQADAPDSTPDERAARRLLALGTRNFGAWERFRNRTLNSASRIGRLLFHHRRSLEAELAGHPARADFFWRELYQDLKTLSSETEVWRNVSRAIADETGAVVFGDPDALRERLVAEVFIDTHCALYNGYLQRSGVILPDDRAFVHTDFISRLLAHSTLAGEALRSVIGPASELRIAVCQEAGHWDRAVEAARLLVKHFPDSIDYQGKLAGIHFSAAIGKMSNGDSTAAMRRDAERALKGIKELDKLLAEFPENETFFLLLGQLHHLRAIKLSNARDLSGALLEIEKALTFHPFEASFHETRRQLIEAMKNLQEQMSAVKMHLESQANVMLSSTGRKLQRAAKRGYRDMDAYIESDEARQTRERFLIAHALQLWRTIGLSAPDKDRNECALQLLEAVNRFHNHPPKKEAGVHKRWRSVIEQDRELADLDSDAICSFLARRLFRPKEGREPKTTVYTPPDEPLVLSAAQSNGGKSAEPFAYWLFSRQDLRLKTLAAAAIIVLCLAAGLWLRESSYRRTRDTAFRQIIASKEENRHPAVIEHAETFLSHLPLGGEDGREDRVLEHYRESLLRWAIEQDGQPNDQLAQHLNRYRQLAPTGK